VDTRGRLGFAGEQATAAWYLARGFEIVARNWRCRAGELDLVVARGDLLVIVEVKTRRGASYGGGFEAVDERKRRKLRQLAERFLQAEPWRRGPVRFDVASVAHARAGISIEVFEDAF
jgi:putative endonuclease